MDIVNPGLVYDVSIDGDRVAVKMAMTASGCPIGNHIVAQGRTGDRRVEGVKKIDVELVYDPPWQESMISEKGRRIFDGGDKPE